MTTKQLCFMIGLFFIGINLFSQVEEPVVKDTGKEKEKIRFADRLVYGGDIGLSFGTITYIKLAPVVGYRLTSRLTAGIGPIYIYEKYKRYNLETSTYGGKAILSFTVFKGSGGKLNLGLGDIVLHAENEIVNVEPLYYYFYLNEYAFGDRLWIDNLLLGGGFIQRIAGRFSVSAFILWDVTRNDFSPYDNPVFKLGFNF
jgi:hypothetical protein